jgi:hypothetical protein
MKIQKHFVTLPARLCSSHLQITKGALREPMTYVTGCTICIGVLGYSVSGLFHKKSCWSKLIPAAHFLISLAELIFDPQPAASAQLRANASLFGLGFRQASQPSLPPQF